MYAIKIRPVGATAWFWLRQAMGYESVDVGGHGRLTTLRARAATFTTIDEARSVGIALNASDLANGRDRDFQVVPLGGHHL